MALLRAIRYPPSGGSVTFSMVKAVVDKHQGGITVESEAGRGTRVRARIPLFPGE